MAVLLSLKLFAPSPTSQTHHQLTKISKDLMHWQQLCKMRMSWMLAKELHLLWVLHLTQVIGAILIWKKKRIAAWLVIVVLFRRNCLIYLTKYQSWAKNHLSMESNPLVWVRVLQMEAAAEAAATPSKEIALFLSEAFRITTSKSTS
jgi:hypothetical protein